MTVTHSTTWEFFPNEDQTVWVAYNNHTYTTHLLCDKKNELWDPCPLIPQVVIDAFHEALYGTNLHYTN